MISLFLPKCMFRDPDSHIPTFILNKSSPRTKTCPYVTDTQSPLPSLPDWYRISVVDSLVFFFLFMHLCTLWNFSRMKIYKRTHFFRCLQIIASFKNKYISINKNKKACITLDKNCPCFVRILIQPVLPATWTQQPLDIRSGNIRLYLFDVFSHFWKIKHQSSFNYRYFWSSRWKYY